MRFELMVTAFSHLSMLKHYAKLTHMKKRYLATALASLLCCSCAYMQSNKNIREKGITYEGCQLNTEQLALCRKGSQWYLATTVENYSKRYPLIYDSILLADNNAPYYEKTGTGEAMACYLPISAGTAATLQMQNGYAHSQDLAAEVNRLLAQKPVIYAPQMSKATRRAISAHIDHGEEPIILTLKQTGEPSFANKALATADFVLVDIPGTLAYNVAIPFMAPIVFFSDFINDEN